ncbi:AMP-binding protein [Crossiella sp. SN42]|uniref:class I adenylate-forming enzyme family protein n=1 Tax=Crossiella sp. SN42 TaxID=2944808 RepID=UPI00207CCAEF|nr:AMP-binding protein [Crossiella sp. SN42]MCO1580272.1 AMP-binding protein [Crossiella sp. SN42]
MAEGARGQVCAGIVTADSHRSLPEVESAALGLAARLSAAGLTRGDRVLLSADNSADFPVALFALLHLDASVVLLDPRHHQAERARAAGMARARFALHDSAEDFLPAGSAPGTTCLRIGDLTGAGSVSGGLSFANWYRRGDGLVCWSSGPSGEPRGIVRSGESVRRNIEATRRRMGYRREDVLLPLLPFSQQYGLSLVLLWWAVGCSLKVTPLSRLDRGLTGEVKATVVDATPATYHSLLNVLERREELRAGIAAVRMWCVGGAPLAPSVAQRFRRLLGAPLLDGYGSTEAGNIALSCVANPVGCGRPLDGVRVEIRAGDGEAKAGQTGEICVRTTGLMAGYLAEDGTVAPFGQEVYRTGDLGFRDGEGNLHVLGRRAAVHRLGHTLYPEALARKARRCGRPVAVVPIEDERRGCQLVFLVADRGGHEARYWRARIEPHLAPYEQPNQLLVVDRLPEHCPLDPRQGTRLVRDLLAAEAERVRADPSEPLFTERAPTAMIYREDRDGTPLGTRDGNRPSGGRGLPANYLTHGGQRIAEPLPLSTVASEHLPGARAGRRRISQSRGGLVSVTVVRSGPLNWAQQWHWLEQQLDPEERFLSMSLTMKRACPVPEGLALGDVEAALATLVDRHEALRTRYSTTEPVQSVCTAEAPVVVVHELPDEEVEPEAAIELAVELIGDEFDLDREWPYRAVVFTREARPVVLVAFVHHISVDARGADIVAEELGELLAAAAQGRPAELGEPRWHPLDQAAMEATEEYQAIAQRARAHWAKPEAAASANLLAPYCGDLPQLRTHYVIHRSRSLLAELQKVCAEYELSPFTVVTAAFAVLVAQRSGSERIAIETVISNRFDEAQAASVGCYALMGQIIVDTSGGPDLRTLLRRTWSAGLRAFRYGHFEPAVLLEVEAREVARRGLRPNAALHLNYRPHNSAEVTEDPSAFPPDEVAAETWDGLCDTLYVHVNPADDVMEVGLRAGDHLLSLAESKELLAGLEGVLKERDALGARLTGTATATLNPGWAKVGQDWVSLELTKETLESCPGVTQAEVVVEPGADGDRLLAHVVVEDPDLGPPELRDFLLEQLYLNPLIMAPGWYRCYADAPAEGADWAEHTVVRQGDGRHGDGAAQTPAEEALAEALAATYPEARIDLADCYAAAGGRFLDIPAVLGRLAKNGYTGISAADLMSPLSLRHIAFRLGQDTGPVEERS